MKYRFYITNLFDGVIQGTDLEGVAELYSPCEDFFVVDTESGEWLTTEGRQDIENILKD